MSINIHGKDYITVAERLQKLHSEFPEGLINITTEVLFTDPVVIKATLVCPRGTFTGISAANASKQIEKESPYEVAETSAVGRCLAFANYETTNGIASAEEMQKIPITVPNHEFSNSKCPKCGAPIAISKSTGKPYCSKLCWKNPAPTSEIQKNIIVQPDAMPF
jgi:hypothetical protein